MFLLLYQLHIIFMWASALYVHIASSSLLPGWQLIPYYKTMCVKASDNFDKLPYTTSGCTSSNCNHEIPTLTVALLQMLNFSQDYKSPAPIRPLRQGDYFRQVGRCPKNQARSTFTWIWDTSKFMEETEDLWSTSISPQCLLILCWLSDLQMERTEKRNTDKSILGIRKRNI